MTLSMSSHRTDNFCIMCGAPLLEGKTCEKCHSQADQSYVKPEVFSRKNQKRLLIINIIIFAITVPLAILILLGDSSFSNTFLISTILDINSAFIISLTVIQILGFIFNIIVYKIGPEKILKKFSFLNENILYAMWLVSGAIGGILLLVIGGIAVLLLIGLLICFVIMR